MRTWLNLAMLVLCMGFAILAYNTSEKTRLADRKLSKLVNEIDLERNRIAVLEAEWAYLNRPERLRHLVKMHNQSLNLTYIHDQSYGKAIEVPYPELELVTSWPVIDIALLEDKLIELDRLGVGGEQ